MGANEGRHVLAMADDLGKVLALELYTAAQALDFRRDMLGAAQQLARTGHPGVLKAKVGNGNGADLATLDAELEALRVQLAQAAEFVPGPVVAAAHARLRQDIPFMPRDRAMDGDITRAVGLVESGELLAAARGAMGP
jgi:histidine ammonia-lyase